MATQQFRPATSRATYQAKRQHARSLADCRTDRGLPHHPDGSGFAACAVCEGAGELMVTCNDPQDDYPEPCTNSACDDGYVADGHVDPLIVLRGMRRKVARTRLPWVHARYGELLHRAYSPPDWSMAVSGAALPWPLAEAA